MALNDTIVSGYQPAKFSLPGFTAWFHDINGFRPVTSVNLDGPEKEAYIGGLLIVPFMLIASLLLFCLLACCAMGINACKRRRRRRSAQENVGQGETKEETFSNKYSEHARKAIWVCFLCLLVASLVSWTCAFAFSIALANENLTFSDDLSAMGRVVNDSNQHLYRMNAYAAQLMNELNQLPVDCEPLPPAAQPDFQSILINVESAANRVTTCANQILSVTVPADSSIQATASAASQLLVIRTAIVATLSGVQMFLTLGLLLLALARFTGKRYCETLTRRCCCNQYCNPLVALIILTLTVSVLLSGVIHAIGLLFADTCTPNVNVNINQIAAEFLDYPPFVEYSGTNVSEMCSLPTSDVAMPPEPPELSFLCFYQTCDLEGPYAQTVIETANQTIKALIEIRNNITNATDNMENNVTLQAACEKDLAQVGLDLTGAIANAVAVVTNLGCAVINDLYARAIYSNLCNTQVYAMLAKYQTIVAANVFIMIAALVRLFCEAVFDTGEEESGPDKRNYCCGCRKAAAKEVPDDAVHVQAGSSIQKPPAVVVEMNEQRPDEANPSSSEPPVQTRKEITSWKMQDLNETTELAEV